MVIITHNQTDFTTKYIIEAEFIIKGVVEKSDVVGAVFGQTEGLLLDLDLRDLQKSGRIGRIEVENKSKEGVSKGIINIPSSLTRKETALLAATIETVTRVGPCEAEIILKGIRDVRETKRKKIIERAAELLKEWDNKSLDASEIEEKIDTDIKIGEIISWGDDNLPAGPDIETDPNIIIVEGRADVLNLLRIGVKNTVAVQGTSVPKSVIELTKRKDINSVTAFLDGDRGGTLILKELLQTARIDYIARAPEGYEVEELSRKQMIKSLQNRVKTSEYSEEKKETEPKVEYKGKDGALYRMLTKLDAKDPSTIIEISKTIQQGNALGIDEDMNKLFEMPVKDVFEKIREHKDTKYLLIDGILSNRLLSLSLNMNIQFIACKNKEEDLKIPNHLSVFFF